VHPRDGNEVGGHAHATGDDLRRSDDHVR
jgi:hypothetical protein